MTFRMPMWKCHDCGEQEVCRMTDKTSTAALNRLKKRHKLQTKVSGGCNGTPSYHIGVGPTGRYRGQ